MELYIYGTIMQDSSLVNCPKFGLLIFFFTSDYIINTYPFT